MQILQTEVISKIEIGSTKQKDSQTQLVRGLQELVQKSQKAEMLGDLFKKCFPIAL
jgi:hypothetical protein